MLLPTILIIAVNLALGFLAAVGRDRLHLLRAPLAGEQIAASRSPNAAAPAESAKPAPPSAFPAPHVEPPLPESPPPEPPQQTPSADEPAREPADEPAAPAGPSAEETDSTGTADSAENAPTDEQLLDESSVDEPATDVAADRDASVDTAPPDEPRADESDVSDVETPSDVDVAATTASASADLPAEWFDLLADIEKEGYGKCQSFVEASTQVLRLEVGRYRGELVRIDDRIRAIFEEFDADALAETLADLDRVNCEWLERQGEAVGHLAARRGNLGELQAAGDRLEEVLLDQTAQIESTRSNIRQLDFNVERDRSQRRLGTEICRLLDMAHVLRDQLQESLLAIVIGEGRIATLDRRLHVDPLTQFVNRAGLEAVLYEWWRDDPNRIRQLSLVMFDVVRLGRIGERYGVATGDGVLSAVGKIIDDTLRKKRGCDLVARYNGQRFVVVLGDTGPRNATSAAERIRQMVAASTFEVAGEPVEVLVSCGVVEVLHDDDSRQLLRRLDAAVAQAKMLGRNTTCLDEGRGPAAIEDPPHYDAKGKVVRLDA